jgi:Phosphopantetheinyl transferase
MNKAYIYLFDDMDSLRDDFVAKNFNKLPLFRQEQCNKYKKESDKKACILAYLLLKKGLREQYNINTPISFRYNEHGKPYLREHPEIFFNISHCKNGVVCAFANFEIGIDIQNMRLFNINTARKICSANELYQLKKLNAPEELFCKIWTEKESYAKAKGNSVASVFKKDLPKNSFFYIKKSVYYLTLCHNGLINNKDILLFCERGN